VISKLFPCKQCRWLQLCGRIVMSGPARNRKVYGAFAQFVRVPITPPCYAKRRMEGVRACYISPIPWLPRLLHAHDRCGKVSSSDSGRVSCEARSVGTCGSDCPDFVDPIIAFVHAN
jgi:hypothetical protein